MIIDVFIKGSTRDLQSSVKIQSEEVQKGIAALLSDCTLNFNLMGIEGDESFKELLNRLQSNETVFNIYMRSVSAFLADKNLYGQTYIDYCDALVEIVRPIRDEGSLFEEVHTSRAIPANTLRTILLANPWLVYYLTLHLDYTTSLAVIS